MKSKLDIFLIIMSLISIGFASGYAVGDDGHKHEEAKSNSKEKEKHDDEEGHGDEESHEHKESGGHAHEEAESPKNVGPNKGIVSFDEHEGFVLSKEAAKNFKIEYAPLQGSSPWNLPKAALVMTRDDVAVFRSRNGKLLRVDVKVGSKTQTHAQVTSKDLNSGDQIVVQGAGFLRVAELDATSGESGHHH